MASRYVLSKVWTVRVGKSLLCVPRPLEQFSRSTYILKRRLPLPRFKNHIDSEFIRRHLPSESEEYICVETGKERRYPLVEIVLTEIVEDVGVRGQVVKCKPIMAYDLVILGKAMYATPENVEKMQILSDDDIIKYSSLTAYKTMKMLKSKVLSVYMNMEEPWIIEPWHVRTNLRFMGVQILSDSCIQLPDKPITGPDLSLEGKDFAVYVTINDSEKFPMRCRLRHYTNVYHKRIVLPPDHECIPSEAIIPEQKELLDTIPLPSYDAEKKMW